MGDRTGDWTRDRKVDDNQCVITASGNGVVVEMFDVLDSPVPADPDGVEAPTGAGGVLPSSGAVSDRQRPKPGQANRIARMVGKPATLDAGMSTVPRSPLRLISRPHQRSSGRRPARQQGSCRYPVRESHKCDSMVPRGGAVIAVRDVGWCAVSDIERCMTRGGKRECRQARGGAAERRA